MTIYALHLITEQRVISFRFFTIVSFPFSFFFSRSGLTDGLGDKSSGDTCQGLSINIPFTSNHTNGGSGAVLGGIKLRTLRPVEDPNAPGYNASSNYKRMCLAENVQVVGTEIVTDGFQFDSGYEVNAHLSMKMRSSMPFRMRCKLPGNITHDANTTLYCEALEPLIPTTSYDAAWFVVFDSIIAYTLENGCIAGTAINGTAIATLDPVLTARIPFVARVHANNEDWGLHLEGVKTSSARSIFVILERMYYDRLLRKYGLPPANASNAPNASIGNGSNGSNGSNGTAAVAVVPPPVNNTLFLDRLLGPVKESGRVRTESNISYSTVSFPKVQQCNATNYCVTSHGPLQSGFEVSTEIAVEQHSDATAMFGQNADARLSLKAYVPFNEEDPPLRVWIHGIAKRLNLSSSIYIESAEAEFMYSVDGINGSMDGTLCADIAGVPAPVRFKVTASANSSGPLPPKPSDVDGADNETASSFSAAATGGSLFDVKLDGYLEKPVYVLPWVELVSGTVKARGTFQATLGTGSVDEFVWTGSASLAVPVWENKTNGTTGGIETSAGAKADGSTSPDRRVLTASARFESRSGQGKRDWRLEITLEGGQLGKSVVNDLASVLAGAPNHAASPLLQRMEYVAGKLQLVISTYDDAATKTLKGVSVYGEIRLKPGEDSTGINDGGGVPPYFAPEGALFSVSLHFIKIAGASSSSTFAGKATDQDTVRITIGVVARLPVVPFGKKVQLLSARMEGKGMVTLRLPTNATTNLPAASGGGDTAFMAMATATPTASTSAADNATIAAATKRKKEMESFGITGKLDFFSLTATLAFLNFTNSIGSDAFAGGTGGEGDLVLTASGQIKSVAAVNSQADDEAGWDALLELRLQRPVTFNKWARLTALTGSLNAKYVHDADKKKAGANIAGNWSVAKTGLVGQATVNISTVVAVAGVHVEVEPPTGKYLVVLSTTVGDIMPAAAVILAPATPATSLSSLLAGTYRDVGDGSTGLGGNTNTGVALQIAMASENMEDFDKAGTPPPIVGGVATPTTDTYR